MFFRIGAFHMGCVVFNPGASHMGFSTDVFVDLEEEEGQGSGSSEQETTTESSMLPTTTHST